MNSRKKFKTVDEYIKAMPKEVRQRLIVIRKIIKKIAPKATEVISYNIPAYKLNGILIYFAGYENHISLYPYRSSMNFTKEELAKHKKGRGTIQFQNNEKLPILLIKRIVKSRVKEMSVKKK